MAESRECHRCHRIGYRGFVPMGDYGWVCGNERACVEREFKRRWGTGDRYSGLRGHANARRGADR